MQKENVDTFIDILVPPSIAFSAWLNKELLHKWLFAPDEAAAIHVEMCAEVGGRFSIVQQKIGEDTSREFTGEYLLIDAPHELRFTLHSPQNSDGLTHIKALFQPVGEGCRITVTQEGNANVLTAQHWHKMLNQLRMSLEVQ